MDEGVSGSLLNIDNGNNVEKVSSDFDMEFPHVTFNVCATGFFNQNSQPQPASESVSSSPVNSAATPSLYGNNCGLLSGIRRYPDSLLNDPDRNLLDNHPDNVIWYGPGCRSPQDDAEESFQYDQMLVKEYIRSDSTLDAQLAFMKKQRRKKKTDHNLIQDYHFIFSLYKTLKTTEFKEMPKRYVTSKAILACLNVTASWLSKAKQVIKLLDVIGPGGLYPDPLVIKRLQSRVVTHKGSDLLTFLKERDSARTSV